MAISGSMSALHWKALYLASLTAALAVTGGCGRDESPAADALGLTPPEELGATVASVGAVGQPGAVAVEGYGLVGGLAGTGSADSPPAIRTYLKRYSLTQVPGERVNADEFRLRRRVGWRPRRARRRQKGHGRQRRRQRWR